MAAQLLRMHRQCRSARRPVAPHLLPSPAQTYQLLGTLNSSMSTSQEITTGSAIGNHGQAQTSLICSGLRARRHSRISSICAHHGTMLTGGMASRHEGTPCEAAHMLQFACTHRAEEVLRAVLLVVDLVELPHGSCAAQQLSPHIVMPTALLNMRTLALPLALSKHPPWQSCSRPTTSVPPDGITRPLPRVTCRCKPSASISTPARERRSHNTHIFQSQSRILIAVLLLRRVLPQAKRRVSARLLLTTRHTCHASRPSS